MEEIVYHSNYKYEDSYWWFVARNRIVYDQILRRTDLAENDLVLDAGCGTGAFSKILSGKFNVVGLDSSELALEYCRKRGLTNLYNCYLDEFPKEEWDVKAITLLDVVEHVEDDNGIIKDAYELLPSGGWLICTVPAYQWMWSRHDEIHMHYRRYNRKNFNDLLEKNGFKIEFSSYFNSLLAPLAAGKRLLGKLIGDKSAEVNPVDPVPKFLDTIFRNIFYFEKNILSISSIPFGISIISIARKI